MKAGLVTVWVPQEASPRPLFHLSVPTASPLHSFQREICKWTADHDHVIPGPWTNKKALAISQPTVYFLASSPATCLPSPTPAPCSKHLVVHRTHSALFSLCTLSQAARMAGIHFAVTTRKFLAPSSLVTFLHNPDQLVNSVFLCASPWASLSHRPLDFLFTVCSQEQMSSCPAVLRHTCSQELFKD